MDFDTPPSLLSWSLKDPEMGVPEDQAWASGRTLTLKYYCQKITALHFKFSADENGAIFGQI